MALTVFSLAMVTAYCLFSLSEATKDALLTVDVPISLIFLADSFGSLRRAPDKRAYLKWGWLDFLGSIPLLENDLVVMRRRRMSWLAWTTACLFAAVAMAGSIYYYYATKV